MKYLRVSASSQCLAYLFILHFFHFASVSNTTPDGIKIPEYDVFINTLGPVVKSGIVRDIYDGLLAQGFKVFLAAEEIQTGDNLVSQIEEVINTAFFHIPVISPGYEESSHCLTELVQMMMSGKEIIPVFYKVNPSQLRWSDGVDAQAFLKYDSQIFQGRAALSELSSHTSGFVLTAFNGDERLLATKVVERVVEIFRKKMFGISQSCPLHEMEGATSDTISPLHREDANGQMANGQMGVHGSEGAASHTIPLLHREDIEMGVVQPSENNNNNQQDSRGLVASDGNGGNPPNGNADSPRSYPDRSNGRDYVRDISSLFATCHGAIFTVVSTVTRPPVSYAVRILILFVSTLVSTSIMSDFVHKSYTEFRSQHRNLYWVIKRIALFLMFIMLSIFLLLGFNWGLRHKKDYQ